MRERWSRDGGPAKAHRTAIDSGPCAAGRAGSTVSDARVTSVNTTVRVRANGASGTILERTCAAGLSVVDRLRGCRQPEGDVDRGSRWTAVDFHRVTDDPH
jgi:hypothetical protein